MIASRARLALGAVVLLAVGMVVGATLFPRHDVVSTAPPSHRVDIGFSQDMIVHHQQAVDMSQLVRGRAGAQVATIAASVEANQLREIGQMQGWLAIWNAPQLASGEPMSWMPEAPGMPGMSHHPAAEPGDVGMPGMASISELNGLTRLNGNALDTGYLQLMIRHHQGGILMAAAAARTAESAPVRGLAASVVVDQEQESAAMTSLLTSLGQAPLAFP